MSKFWEGFGRLAMVSSVAFGALTAYDFLSESEADVLVVVSHGRFTWPRLVDNKYGLLSESDLNALNNIKKYSKIKSSWYVGIHNNGDKEAQTLNLRLPYTYSYQLARDGQERVEAIYRNVIIIPELQPSESVYVVGWSEKELLDSDMNSISLTHSEGFAKISSYVEVKSFWKKISQKWDDMVLALGVLALLVFGYQLYSEIKQNPHNKANHSDR